MKVIIVEDRPLIQNGLRCLLETRLGAEVVGETGDVPVAIGLARSRGADVILFNVENQPVNGIEAIRQLHEQAGAARIAALFLDGARTHDVLEAGATACLAKDASAEEFLHAVQEVAHGRKFLSPQLVNGALDDYVRQARGETTLAALSKREQEILQHIAAGQSSVDIASRLHLSSHTVDTHRRNIMEKLGIHNLAGLIKFAIRHGLCSL